MNVRELIVFESGTGRSAIYDATARTLIEASDEPLDMLTELAKETPVLVQESVEFDVSLREYPKSLDEKYRNYETGEEKTFEQLMTEDYPSHSSLRNFTGLV